MSMKIFFYYPGKAFPGVSLTGPDCWLRCDHCRGRYLEGMLHVTEPSEFINLASDLRSKGARGLLISGGEKKYQHGIERPHRPSRSCGSRSSRGNRGRLLLCGCCLRDKRHQECSPPRRHQRRLSENPGEPRICWGREDRPAHLRRPPPVVPERRNGGLGNGL